MKKNLNIIKYYLIASAVAAVIFVSPVLGDIITFKDGTTMEGKLKSQTADSIEFVSDGKIETFPKKYLKSLRYGQTSSEKRKYDDLKKRSKNIDKENLDPDQKKSVLQAIQRDLDILFKEQDDRRKIAEAVDEEFQKLLEKERSGPNSLMRQAIWPGWGFYYLGHNKKAAVWAGAYGVFMLNAVVARQDMLERKKKYRSSVELMPVSIVVGIPPAIFHFALVEDKFKAYSRSSDKNNTSMKMLAGVYIASFVHLSWDNWFSKMLLGDNGTIEAFAVHDETTSSRLNLSYNVEFKIRF